MQVILGFLVKHALDWLLKLVHKEVERRQKQAAREREDAEKAKVLLDKLEVAQTKEERIEAARAVLRGRTT